jgi:hypothetical protein
MNGQQLLEAMKYVDESIITETSAYDNDNGRRGGFGGAWRRRVMTAVAAAAAACVLVAAAVLLGVFGSGREGQDVFVEPTDYSHLPILPVQEFWDWWPPGYERNFSLLISLWIDGVTTHDIHAQKPFCEANPWYEGNGVTHLPIFPNSIRMEGGLAQETKRDFADYVNGFLGLSGDFVSLPPSDTDYKSNGFNPLSPLNQQNIINNGGNVGIYITAEGVVHIIARNNELLSEEMRIIQESPEHNNIPVCRYLCDKYAPLFHTKGDLYDYGMNIFNCQSSGNIPHGGALNGTIPFSLIRPKEIGYYPIITLEEARERLMAGEYISPYIENSPFERQIVAATLVYPFNQRFYSDYIMPFYVFAIEMPGSLRVVYTDDGTAMFGKEYKFYYVPAVRGDLLEDSSAWATVPTYDWR